MAPAKTLNSLVEEKSIESRFVRDEDERPKVAYNEFSNDIPVISLAGLEEEDGRRGEICKKIVEAFEEWGIFQIVDHAVFALPPEEKLRLDMTRGKKGGFLVSSHLQVNYFLNPINCISSFFYVT